ncbi:MAG TPA: 5-methyltetrahydropteroyltriglutamate--homocysteine S-methyltransferase [Stellaceae bacterium]|nr:5-methyltetrahydropteroyltriglutamate--homocysteine S-methyltransferase [Stellaceae bacterium]
MPSSKPPFRADHIGSLLRTAALRDARAQRQRGEITVAALKAVEDREIEKIIAKQAEIGLQAISDGEFRRSWWHLDFLAGLKGTEWYEMDQGIAFSGTNTRAQGIRVVGKLACDGHPMVQHFKFLQAHTDRTAKMTIPAPSALYGRTGRAPISRAAYPSLDEFFADLGAVYRKVVRAFADAGCRYLQLDEVFIAMLCDDAYCQTVKQRGDDPKRLGEIYGDLINEAMADIPADMTVTMHLCRGNYKSTFMGSGGYDPVAEILFNRIKVHGYFLEYDSDRAGGFEPLRRLPKDRRAVLGLVTSKTGALESKEVIKRRIDEASRVVALEQLCLSPQCGFASTEEGNVLAETEQWAKLRRVVEVADEVWGKGP